MIILNLLLTLITGSLLAPEEPATIYDLTPESWINACSFAGQPFYARVSMSCRRMYRLESRDCLSMRSLNALIPIYFRETEKYCLCSNEDAEARQKIRGLMALLIKIQNSKIKLLTSLESSSSDPERQIITDILEGLKEQNGRVIWMRKRERSFNFMIDTMLKTDLEDTNETILLIHNSVESNPVSLIRDLRYNIEHFNHTWSRFQEELGKGILLTRVNKIYEAALGRANSVLRRYSV